MLDPTSIDDIKHAIHELSVRAELARKENRQDDADEMDRRIQRLREKLSQRSPT
ncbi:hypothetical protein [Mycobacterium bourgelatii]|uniref:Uncharacterized protein n=1 Tax=Mycobacterium bourgelatii TaxID=1273442 RepID=A0A7I9YH55_MYCBU|nr:hypothetical protein [Mycobacterium bourgelatii]MCV6976722.1 hypothetical protein [Mycobacterium bourgelatii]GFG88010.1 hypothetical protein MBOU_00520 [Mycobacterium bourgelatii]